MDLSTLKAILQRSWSKDTSYDPESWSPSNSAWGQCAITALIVQDFFGGEILLTEAELPDGERILHFYNQLGENPSGVDLTRDQFPEGTIVPAGISEVVGFPTTRDYILAYENTVRRYEHLTAAVTRNLHRPERSRTTPSRVSQTTFR